MKPWYPLAILTCSLLQAQAQPAQPIIENEYVRVMRVTVTENHKTAPHDHKMNRVMIYLDPGRQITRYEGGRTTDVTWKAGQALWSPASGTHVAEITATNPVTIVEVELKKATGSPVPVTGTLDPVKVDPGHYHVEFENDQVRVLRVRIGPGESAPLHQHSLPRLVVFLTPQKVEVTSPEGKKETVAKPVREVSWAGQASHSEKNINTEPFEVVVVEMKGA